MKIAIDCREILNPAAGIVSGIPEYIDGLTRALLQNDQQNEWIIFFREDYPHDSVEKILSLSQKARAVFLPYKRGNFFINHWQAATVMRSVKPDIMLFPSGQVPLGWSGRSVVTAHDLAIYDHPEWFPKQNFSRWLSTKFIVPHGFRQADKIIAVSEATKKDLIRHFKIQSEKIFVVYPAVTVPTVNKITTEEIRQKFNLPEKYFLCLGTIEPRKNFSLAVRATKILSDQDVDIHLVIAGKRGWKWQETVEEIEKVNQNKKIISELGYVSVDEKYALLAGTQALIFPSLYEGFGLPVLEAMSLGVPVITTAVGSLPEVGGGAVKYVSHNDPDELVQVILEIKKKLNEVRFEKESVHNNGDRHYRVSKIEQVFSQAAKFSWQKTVKKIIKILL